MSDPPDHPLPDSPSPPRDDGPGPHAVEISDEQSALDVPHDLLAEIVRGVLAAERVAAARIGVALVDDETIAVLNRRWLDHEGPTDVLSFVLDAERVAGVPGNAGKSVAEDDPGASDVPRGAGLRIDGDVIVSTDTALRQAAEFSWSPLDELLLYVVHGVLHLLGYDDLCSAERDLMRTRERDLLRTLRPDLVEIPGRPLPTGASTRPVSSVPQGGVP